MNSPLFCYLYLLRSIKIVCMTSFFFNILRLRWPNTWFGIEDVPCKLNKNVYFVVGILLLLDGLSCACLLGLVCSVKSPCEATSLSIGYQLFWVWWDRTLMYKLPKVSKLLTDMQQGRTEPSIHWKLAFQDRKAAQGGYSLICGGSPGTTVGGSCKTACQFLPQSLLSQAFSSVCYLPWMVSIVPDYCGSVFSNDAFAKCDIRSCSWPENISRQLKQMQTSYPIPQQPTKHVNTHHMSLKTVICALSDTS